MAILAEKLGAEYILAVDNDDWCIENASENTLINQCKNIEIQKVDKVNDGWRFDVVIANINRHIIEANLSNLSAVLLPHSTLILSGLLQSDEMDILSACKLLGLNHQQTSILFLLESASFQKKDAEFCRERWNNHRAMLSVSCRVFGRKGTPNV